MHDGLNMRIPGQRPPERQHQSWCDDHMLDDQGFGTCVSADIVAPGLMVQLTWTAGGDVKVNVATGDQIDIATLDEVEQRALAMLTQVLVGRGLTPPASAIAATQQGVPA